MELQSVYFGQRHPDFDYKDIELIAKIKRLSRKHHKQAENSCNGYGIVKGQMYYTGAIDDYARREYGQGVKDGCIGDDGNVFDAEADRIQDKIIALIANNKHFTVEFQGDPRGNTVKLRYDGEYIEL